MFIRKLSKIMKFDLKDIDNFVTMNEKNSNKGSNLACEEAFSKILNRTQYLNTSFKAKLRCSKAVIFDLNRQKINKFKEKYKRR